MPITRNIFFDLLKQSVIHSAPVGDFSGMASFAVVHDLLDLENDVVQMYGSSDTPYYYSNHWAATGRKVDEQVIRFPAFVVLPIGESIENIGNRSVNRRTTYGLYFLAQYKNQPLGTVQKSVLDIQDAMGIHAKRVFQLLADVCYASADGGDYEYTFEKLLQSKQSASIITSYNLNTQVTNQLRKELRVETNAPGGYVDDLGKNALYGTTYTFNVLECLEDDYPLTYNKICCE